MIATRRDRGLVHLDAGRAMLAAAGVEVVVATSAAHVLMLGGYQTWLERETRGWMFGAAADAPRAGFAYLDATGVTGLGVSPLFEAQAQLAATADHVVSLARLRGSIVDDLPTLAEELRALGLATGVIGFEADGCPPQALERLQQLLPGARIVDATGLLRRLRAFKSPEAIRRLREVAVITERGLQLLRQSQSPAEEWQHELRVAFAHDDADLDHVVYGLPEGGLGQTAPRDPALGAGFYVDAGARRSGFVSDTGVTFATDPDDPLLRSRYSPALDALEAGASMLRPGVSTGLVWKTMRAITEGVPGLLAQGHGLGFDVRELPRIAAPSTDRFENEEIAADMVVNLELAQFFADGTSIQIESTYLVTADATEPLIEADRHSPWEFLPVPPRTRKAFTHG